MSEYVKERIAALRREQPGTYGNIACARTNAMKFLPNYFGKGQLEKLFFLFPDPHFKVRKGSRRLLGTRFWCLRLARSLFDDVVEIVFSDRVSNSSSF